MRTRFKASCWVPVVFFLTLSTSDLLSSFSLSWWAWRRLSFDDNRVGWVWGETARKRRETLHLLPPLRPPPFATIRDQAECPICLFRFGSFLLLRWFFWFVCFLFCFVKSRGLSVYQIIIYRQTLVGTGLHRFGVCGAAFPPQNSQGICTWFCWLFPTAFSSSQIYCN